MILILGRVIRLRRFMINLFYPYVPKEAIEAVVDVLRSRFIGQGPQVDRFEKIFCDHFNVKNAVSLNSGTAALATAYELIGIGPGDEVITTPLTCTATNIELLRLGAKLVWADISPDTLCIDRESVKSKLTSKTKAIVQVHLGGLRAECADIQYDTRRIPVVSDAAQALGIFTGDYTCCSFQAIKQITTIDGGMLIAPSFAEAHKAKLLRWFGIDRDKKIANNWQAYKERKMIFDIEVLGTKRHMNDVAAAMGVVGIAHYDHVMGVRYEQFSKYKELLSDVRGLRIIDSIDNTCWLCTVIVERRDDFVKKLFEADIDSNVVQVRNDIYKVFGGKRQDLPVMNELEEKYLSIPLGPHITMDDVEYICKIIKGGW
ncbi:DegT/DnrJ/EryC1/StrS family aminotransferase [Patescibacteria group bacterium]|uniref:Putative DegT/DnrJ/EryC1/StrS aminotransferase family protein n=1 Tax=viral metagenome TaxID=1070528 RepID=A0A6M3KJG3_9ZZZZ|nr:DegT/DnrJ/EryC1/StrS family aminotransferase [Patescibacteria group bacterium]